MVIDKVLTDRYALFNGDALEVLPDLPSGSVDFSVYSPAFPELYQYSNDPRDFANCVTYEEGVEHYGYLVREMFRLTAPGRLTAVHCMDLKRGSWWQRDFPGDIIRLHEAAGWNFFCRVTIWKDPWLIARRTRMRSLMHKTIVEDSSRARVAGADYILVFTKGGENLRPITHPMGLSSYAGEEEPPADLVARFRHFDGDQRKNLLSHWIWRRYASPVWMDIRSGRLLPYKGAKENPEERHVCPLQLDVIERCLVLWSKPGDAFLTPCAGVGSEAYMAVRHGCRGVAVELKESYYRQMVQNVQAASREIGEQVEMEWDDPLPGVDPEELLLDALEGDPDGGWPATEDYNPEDQENVGAE